MGVKSVRFNANEVREDAGDTGFAPIHDLLDPGGS
ncbi:hypothetical protein SAMN05920897_1224 [Alkalispirochaeta americana]|uniref:Uncharacterized protein n=1 Tax=Alkalispirochaeta americana TaxID=159291 RepID=A0A1N6XB34_9SPIO|nr:hypothetical protein SAMN05920897_1224 [Alkalispirochaeta americana]